MQSLVFKLESVRSCLSFASTTEKGKTKSVTTRKDRVLNERSLQVIPITQLPVSYTVKDNIPGANIMD